jgi:hypothetical protein
MDSNEPKIQRGTKGEQKQKQHNTTPTHTERERREGHKA